MHSLKLNGNGVRSSLWCGLNKPTKRRSTFQTELCLLFFLSERSESETCDTRDTVKNRLKIFGFFFIQSLWIIWSDSVSYIKNDGKKSSHETFLAYLACGRGHSDNYYLSFASFLMGNYCHMPKITLIRAFHWSAGHWIKIEFWSYGLR